MGVVMLDGDAPALREVAGRVLRRQIPRMHVVDDVLGLYVEQPLQVREVRLEGAVRQQVLEIARVWRHVGAAAPGQREGVLEFRADRQKRGGSGDGQGEWLRGVAAATADQTLAPLHDPRHGVDVACQYLTI